MSALEPCWPPLEEAERMLVDAIELAHPRLEASIEPPRPAPVPYWECPWRPWRIITRLPDPTRPQPVYDQGALL